MSMQKQMTYNPNIEARKLYEVSDELSKDDRKKLGLRFPVKVFVQDPLVANKNKKKGILGLEDIDINWEPGITNGPTSARIAVVDYDAHTGILAKPVKWDPQIKEFINADSPESYRFHQVNVWAIVQNTLAFFEDPFVMGRPIPWGFDGNKLIVVPHAGIMKNAMYNRKSKSLQFYYFNTKKGPVYTCLSHDIITHETGHAILDGIRPFYNNVSSAQTTAFHEFIADMTAILSGLRINSVRQAVAEVSQGNLKKAQVIADLAEQFAREDVENTYEEAQRYYLRTATNKLKMKDIEDEWEPHLCSQVLTGAMYDLLTRITKLHMDRGLSPAGALWRATDHLNRMAFRALDFCPPVDIQFIDYINAVMRTNDLAYPADTLGYMDIMQNVFEKRGLKWAGEEKIIKSVNLSWKYDLDSIASSRTAAYHFLNDNRGFLDIPLQQDIEVVDLYYTNKVMGAYKKLPREIILEYIWKEDICLEGERFGQLQNEYVPLLCGGTLVFDERGNILYWSKKSGTQTGEVEEEGKKRRDILLDYVENLINAGMIGLTKGEEFDGLDIHQPAIMGELKNGSLQFELTPHLLHFNKNKGGD